MTAKRRSLLSLFVILLVLIGAAQVMAQGTSTTSPLNTREITGTVTAVTATTITVNGHVIDISQAGFVGTIGVGAMLKVHYTVAADGTLVAREIQPTPVVVPPNAGDVGTGHDLNDDNGQDNLMIGNVNDNRGQDNAAAQVVDQRSGQSGQTGNSGHQEDGSHQGSSGDDN